MGFFSSAADPFGLFGDGQSGMDMMGGGSGGGLPGMDMFTGIFGGGGGGGSSIFGSKPIVPGFKSTDATKEQKEAIKGNIKSFGKAKKLSHKVNVFNYNELKSMLKKSIPQYQAMVKAGSQRTMDLLTNPSFASMLRGEIPLDVQEAIQNNAAAKSIGGGYSGSQLHGNLVARDLGLTSLDLIKQGSELTTNSISAAERWMANTKALSVPAQHDVSSMFITPAERIANTQMNNANQWQRNWLAAQVAAAPDPAARGAFDTAMGLAGMVMGIYSGGPGYQNYYKSPWQGGGGPGGPGGPGGGGGGGGYNANYLPSGQPNWNNTTNTGPGYGDQAAMQAGINSSVGIL